MRKLATLVLAGVLLTPAVARAGSSTDAALGLGAFAVFNQILGGVGIFGGWAQPAPVYAAPAPVVYAPPPPVIVAPAPVYVAPRPIVVMRPVVVQPYPVMQPYPVYYAPRPVVVVRPPHRGHHRW